NRQYFGRARRNRLGDGRSSMSGADCHGCRHCKAFRSRCFPSVWFKNFDPFASIARCDTRVPGGPRKMASMTRVIALKARRQTRVEELAFLWTVFATIPAGFDLSREVSAIAIAGLVMVAAVIIWLEERRLLVADPVIVLGVAWIA